tara:strand:+ start:258 stop:437 length:180 start_codon:yes stop_codon:yes gene_type:complete
VATIFKKVHPTNPGTNRPPAPMDALDHRGLEAHKGSAAGRRADSTCVEEQRGPEAWVSL